MFDTTTTDFAGRSSSPPFSRCDSSWEEWRIVLYGGSVEEINSLVKEGWASKINDPICEDDNKLPLLIAAARGDDITTAILEAGAAADRTSAFNGTALQCAAERGDKATVEVLLKYGANINAKPSGRGTALIAAVRNSYLEIVALLLQEGADPNQLDGYKFCSPLSAAPNFAAVKILIDYGANVLQKCRDPHALIKAIKRFDEQSVQILLQYGADANMQLSGVDVLTMAIETGNESIVKMLLEKGANVHGAGRPASPIITAAMRGFEAILTMLIEYGADVNVSNELYGTPLIAAASKGHIDIVPVLLRCGAIVDCFSQHHGTPLIAAAAAGHMKVAALLMDYGADLARAVSLFSLGTICVFTELNRMNGIALANFLHFHRTCVYGGKQPKNRSTQAFEIFSETWTRIRQGST